MPTPLLQMQSMTKSYPGVRALADVSLTLHGGEILALLGENGAGKSTLVKMLAGAVRPDAGTIHLEGHPLHLSSPVAARRAGIAVIYQEFNLIPALSVAENIFLGQELSVAGWLRLGEERRRASELLERLGLRLDPDLLCRHLSVAQQQIVEIAKALATRARILVLDEPSAALTTHEIERFFDILRDLRKQGLGIIYISHRLDEIFALADRVQVLRDGQQVAEARVEGEAPTRQQLIEWMVGRRIDQEFPRRQVALGEPRLVVGNLRRGTRVRDVSFHIRRGEVVGLTGLVGAGRTETARLLFGADPRDGGTITLDGRPLLIDSPRDAIRQRLCLLPEDRKGQGLVLGMSVRDNFLLPTLPRFARFGFLRRALESSALGRFVDALRIRIVSVDRPVRQLSGGNQQKVVLAKWLQANCDVIVFDEPTRGIDVAAKYDLYLLMNDLAAQGKAILLISSELPEVLGMCDRILVMHEGRITGEITDVANATQEDVLRLAVG